MTTESHQHKFTAGDAVEVWYTPVRHRPAEIMAPLRDSDQYAVRFADGTDDIVHEHQLRELER